MKVILLFLIALCLKAEAQDTSVRPAWHGKHRELRYRPDNNDFVIHNGTHRFNRALYGSHSGFRVEAGDLPEFAMYMPGMGGTLRLGLISGDDSKWLIDAANVEARHQAGTMFYNITDPVLKTGCIKVQVLALHDADGMIVKVQAIDIPTDVELFWAFGGATGKRFSREGDIGADPESSFYLKPEYCMDNEYFTKGNNFDLYYGAGLALPEELEAVRIKKKRKLSGIVPAGSGINIGDATRQDNPLQFFQSVNENAPAISGKFKPAANKPDYFFLTNPDTGEVPEYVALPDLFIRADNARRQVAGRIKIETPDTYINAAGSVLAIAADAIWDGVSYQHGAVAWRMPLNGWRGAYTADCLGWHDRAKTHFKGYFSAQYTTPDKGPVVPDTVTNLARQKEEQGTALFTDGYISRSPGKINKPHHYDMNLVFIAQLLRHFRWTGDLDFVRESWPVLERHLAWEKRNFDADGDGLYDAYCCIWASDALQYSGGGVTHSTAYNYNANLAAAKLAGFIGEDPEPYGKEAEKIRKAVNDQLWLHEKGWYAEYKDLIGNRLAHPSAGLWTIYHAIDEGLADPFQAYQSIQYVNHSFLHIPVSGKGVPPGDWYTLATTNWMPYTWSNNNVALAEVLHTALACWQAGRCEEAFVLAKSSLLDYMFMGTSPGNFGQLSFYDAFRGELYRDFADPVGMASRAFIEGLFGINPDLLDRTLTINPGWPAEWDRALLETPDLKLDFKSNDKTDLYKIESRFPVDVQLNLKLKARGDKIKYVTVNGKKNSWTSAADAVGSPAIELVTPPGKRFTVEVAWAGTSIEMPDVLPFYAEGEKLSLKPEKAEILEVYDPQGVLMDARHGGRKLEAVLTGEHGFRTVFIKVKQGEINWWQPVSFELRQPVKICSSNDKPDGCLSLTVQNNRNEPFTGVLSTDAFIKELDIPGRSESEQFVIPAEHLVPGSNRIKISDGGFEFAQVVVTRNINTQLGSKFETIDLSGLLNDRIVNIFSKQYYSPRSLSPTLSLPVQGIGDWCSYNETADIDDTGLRAKAGADNSIMSPRGIPFKTTAGEAPNILFTSRWDNYPDSVSLPLSGKASHLYLLMCGSAHHMQCRMVNGVVTVHYTDGSADVLELISPDNWWPVEQDYYEDGLAFRIDAPRPPRLHLKTGEWHAEPYNVLARNKTIKIEGGAASLLDLPLNPAKELRTLSLQATTNDVVIGLIAATLLK